MALINCSECGKQVSDQAETCPNCGNPISASKPEAKPETGPEKKKMGCMKIMGIGFLVLLGFGVIGNMLKSPEDKAAQEQAARDRMAARRAEQAAAEDAPQALFLKINREYAKKYGSAGSDGATKAQQELIEKQAVAERKTALQPFNDFTNWEVEVQDVRLNNLWDNNKETNFAELETKFGFQFGRFAGVVLENSDRQILGASKNVILETSPLYPIVLGLKKDQKILVSGTFWKNDKGEMVEQSLTESGGMTSPEYVVTFTEIAPK